MSALDTIIRKLEGELEERVAAHDAILEHAAQEGREPNEGEKATLKELTNRMGEINNSLEGYDATDKVVSSFQSRARELDASIATRRSDPDGVEYRSAGEYAVDVWKAGTGSQEARARLDNFYQRAAAHQKTPDNLGVVPDPIVGDVINFIDSGRPLVNAIGVSDLPGATFYLPIVTQQPAVAVQGAAGAAADEKAELTSQKMTIARTTVTATTYGGYLNVSRQDIDFSSPPIMDIVIEGLANAYAIQTEAAVGTKLDASTGTPVVHGTTAATITAAVWAVAATVYTAVKGQGELILAVAPDKLALFGPLFPPIAPANGQSQGLFAGRFEQGDVGAVSGIRLVMSAGLASTKAFLFSTAAIKLFEQRVGAMSVNEPSVFGVQVGYAGYFSSVITSNNGIIELTTS